MKNYCVGINLCRENLGNGMSHLPRYVQYKVNMYKVLVLKFVQILPKFANLSKIINLPKIYQLDKIFQNFKLVQIS